mmetsp:Transcript_13044/g.30947  ORF Transcript_13044/g.30947 Transcript_13044/m.30947 type:complete len:96 (-) Transcript_13044:580-867(-)
MVWACRGEQVLLPARFQEADCTGGRELPFRGCRIGEGLLDGELLVSGLGDDDGSRGSQSIESSPLTRRASGDMARLETGDPKDARLGAGDAKEFP